MICTDQRPDGPAKLMKSNLYIRSRMSKTQQNTMRAYSSAQSGLGRYAKLEHSLPRARFWTHPSFPHRIAITSTRHPTRARLPGIAAFDESVVDNPSARKLPHQGGIDSKRYITIHRSKPWGGENPRATERDEIELIKSHALIPHPRQYSFPGSF